MNRDADVIEGHAVEIDPVDGRAIDAAMPPARTGLPAPTAPSPAEALAQVATERAADSLPPAALQAGRVDLQARLDKLLAGNPTHDPNRKLLGHLRNERESLLTFLDTPDVQATNWRAEQAIRPAVVNRKHWGGNRTRQGAETQQVLMSVIRTARAQDADPRAPARRLAAARARPMSDPTRRPPRYRLVVHEIRDGRQTRIMDATASGFIAAAASTQHARWTSRSATAARTTSKRTSRSSSPTTTASDHARPQRGRANPLADPASSIRARMVECGAAWRA